MTLSIYFLVSVTTMRIYPSCTVKKECMLKRFEYFKWKREGTTEMNMSYHIDNKVDLNTHSSLYENSEISEPSNDDILKISII